MDANAPYTDLFEEPAPGGTSVPDATAPHRKSAGTGGKPPRKPSDRRQMTTVLIIIALVGVFVGVSCMILFFTGGQGNSEAYEAGLPAAYENTYRCGLLSASICKIYAQTGALAQEEGLDPEDVIEALEKEAEKQGYPAQVTASARAADDAFSSLAKPSKQQQDAHALLCKMYAQAQTLKKLALDPDDLAEKDEQRYLEAYDTLTDCAAKLRQLYPDLPDLDVLQSDIMFPTAAQ